MSVKNGDTIRVHYHGKLVSGETFDSSAGRDPLEFKVGAGSVIPGFDAGVLEMNVGDKKTIHIPFAEAYGAKREDMVLQVPRTQVPPDLNPEIGGQLHMTSQSGQIFPVTVVGINDEFISLDANHQLAGKDLIFDLELVEILG